MLELVIIGAGPAGMTASIYAARYELDFVCISKDLGGQLSLTPEIGNFPTYTLISGYDLAQKFLEHVRSYDVDLRLGEEVLRVERIGDRIEIETRKYTLESRSVIIATGRRPRELGVPGEKELRGRGVSYCPACDAPLFASLPVAVVGGGNSAMTAALHLARIAEKVYLITKNPYLKGEEVLKEKIAENEKIHVIYNARTKEILGDRAVSGIRLDVDGREVVLDVRGVFVEIGTIPNSELARGVEKNERGEIVVDPWCRTSVDGVFAAGDVTNVPAKQAIVAAGEGAKAAISAFEYLSRLRT